MVVFPNCKINLGLHILRKRGDGFHDLETVFYPVALQDALEIITNTAGDGPVLHPSGLVIDGRPEDNICTKAYGLLKADFPLLPPVHLHLHKVIPAGAGLGGGSADGAFTLLALNRKYRLGLTEEQLLRYALQLGSDCPFFIHNKPCLARGRGEEFEAIGLDLSAFKVLLVNPKIHVNTGWAFSQLQPTDQRPSLKEVVESPVATWQNRLENDFEGPIFSKFPEIAALKAQLYALGALYASMSGSGSTVYGLFPKEQPLSPSFPAHYFVREC
ncbi:4-(cytidine 5'-diphospho)-2-C-methyl-D-erythritol kinase [Paraflavisolibacter sp. H34]|uniref:4-(cytidine 5'-diphospho)-2-C-methyl-D-erythritol kinase n=1 Tax=Huijunlia imazamoxiresistens TaxID=3127457 RepID=UPI003015DE56